MPLFQVQNLIDRAAAIADMHDGFVKPAEWLAWYNLERSALQLFMARQGAAMQNLQFTTAVAPDVVTLSGEFIAVVGVWEITQSGRNRPVRLVNFPSNFAQGLAGPITGPAEYASIEDINDATTTSTKLRFFPRDTSGTYTILTAAAPARATSVSDTTSLPMGLEERIVLGMARRAMIKEESDVTEIKALIREEDAKVESYCWSRALAESPSVRNVDDVQRGWRTSLTIPGPESWLWV